MLINPAIDPGEQEGSASLKKGAIKGHRKGVRKVKKTHNLHNLVFVRATLVGLDHFVISYPQVKSTRPVTDVFESIKDVSHKTRVKDVFVLDYRSEWFSSGNVLKSW